MYIKEKCQILGYNNFNIKNEKEKRKKRKEEKILQSFTCL